MRNKIVRRACYALILSLFSFNLQAQCVNGDAELGTFANWNGYTSKNFNGNVDCLGSNPVALPLAGQIDVMGIGFDPIIGGSLLKTNWEGNYGFRLGVPFNQFGPNFQAQTISYTVGVTAANAHTAFSFALVMVDPPANHLPINKPFFSWWLSSSSSLSTSLTGSNLLRPVYTKIANAGDPDFTKAPNFATSNVIYKDWEEVCVDLSEFIGQDVTFYFHTANCDLGASDHYAYAYIDGLCKYSNGAIARFNMPAISSCPSTIICDGSGSQYVKNYYWKMEQIDCKTRMPLPNTAKSQYFYNAKPGVLDVLGMYRLQGGNVQTGCWRITLGVMTCNGAWANTYKDVDLNLPLLITGNVYRCCRTIEPVILTAIGLGPLSSDLAGPSFTWYTERGVNLGSGTISSTSGTILYHGVPRTYVQSSLLAPKTTNGRYRVVITDPSGCTNEAWVYVINLPGDATGQFTPNYCYSACDPIPTTLSFNITGYDFCNADFSKQPEEPYYTFATAPGLLYYHWSTGETTPSITITPGVSLYKLTVSNNCFSKTFTYVVPPLHPLTGPLPTLFAGTPAAPPGSLWCSTAFVPGNPLKRFVFYEVGLSKGVAPAYNATSYVLEIFDRWGTKIYQMGKSAGCAGFMNGDIYWDGSVNSGPGNHNLPVNPNDTYFWQLKLSNCYNHDINGNIKTYSGNVTAVQ